MYVPIWVLIILVLLAILGIVSSLGIHLLSQCMPDQPKKK